LEANCWLIDQFSIFPARVRSVTVRTCECFFLLAPSVWSLYKPALPELAAVDEDGSMKEALVGAGEELADDSASAMARARRTSHKRRS
jgi:hypothetical protein